MRQFDWGAGGRVLRVHDRLLTVANGISLLRLAGLPLFLWLLLAAGRTRPAAYILAAVSATDFVDGYVARRFDQVTRLGQVLDPLIDRALMLAATTGLYLAGVLPWPVVAALLGRDVLLLAGASVIGGRARNIAVTRLGKVATATLMLALPILLVAHGGDGVAAGSLRLAGVSLLALGLVGYWGALVQYARAALR